MSLPPFQYQVDRHAHRLRRHLVALVGPADADDLTQETLLAALRAYPDLAADADVRAWLWRIARNKAIDRYRARGRAPATVPFDDADPGIDQAAGAAGWGSGEGDPDEALWAAVGSLPMGQRLAVTLRFVDDLSYADIGRYCDCSPAAARQRVHEGIQKLRQEVGS